MRSKFVEGFEKSAGALSTVGNGAWSATKGLASMVTPTRALNVLGNAGDAVSTAFTTASKMSKARNGVQALAGSYV